MKFTKYQGTGNDFIILDDREHTFAENQHFIAALCAPHFGIGSDGLLLLREKQGFDFEMIYYNSDGTTATFCGNGARCLVAFAKSLGLVGEKALFCAADGVHHAQVLNDDGKESRISLQMADIIDFQVIDDVFLLNTGTPHFVKFVDDVMAVDILNEGRKIRYSKEFEPDGTNVNFVQIVSSGLKIRTYEKGVENETLSCGTGSTAAAIAASLKQGGTNFVLHTLGGDLNVRFEIKNSTFTNVHLIGPAIKVFGGNF